MTEESKLPKLNNRQTVFIEVYLQCWNASEAVRRAGYKGKANVVGSQLLANVNIQAHLQKRIAEIAMSADEVLLRLAEQARANIVDFMDEEPRIAVNREGEVEGVYQSGSLDWEELRKRGHLIKKISFNQYGPVIEMVDGQAALVHIGRHFKLFTDRVESEEEHRIIWDLPTPGSPT